MTDKPGHERSDAPPKWVALGLAGFLMLVGFGALVALGVGAGFEARRPAPRHSAFDLAAATPAAPRLAVDARADRQAIEQQAEAHLTGYAWADKAAGVARIPIDRAMALQAAQGWPDTDTAASSAPGSPP